MKGFISLATLAIIGVIAFVGALVAVPGLANSITSMIIDSEQTCSDAPYNTECYCFTGYRKTYVPWLGVPRWHCEKLEALLLDPDSQNFETEAVNFVQSYLANNCGNIWTDACNGVYCGCTPENPDCDAYASSHPIYPNNACISPVFGYGNTGARLVNVECVVMTTWGTPQGELMHEEALIIYGNQPNENIRPSSGTCPWRMQFFVESETQIPTTLEVLSRSNYCYNSETEQKCTHQSICDYYVGRDGSADWCVGDLELIVLPNDYPMSVFGLIKPYIGSGYPAPDGR